jgi:hypothetical protein
LPGAEQSVGQVGRVKIWGSRRPNGWRSCCGTDVEIIPEFTKELKSLGDYIAGLTVDEAQQLSIYLEVVHGLTLTAESGGKKK